MKNLIQYSKLHFIFLRNITPVNKMITALILNSENQFTFSVVFQGNN